MKMKTLLSILTLLSFTSSAFAQNGGDYDELMRQSRKADDVKLNRVKIDSKVFIFIFFGLEFKDI